jgi:hypothetical protein
MITTPHHYKTLEEMSEISESLVFSMLIDELEALSPGFDKNNVKLRIEVLAGRCKFWAFIED